MTSLRTIDQPATQVTVDGHLLAWHRIQTEARGHLGHTLRALGDDQKVNEGDDQKDHQPHGEIAPHHKITERLDNVAGVLIHQDQTGRCNR